jgi:PAS domain S-box-containing protein
VTESDFQIFETVGALVVVLQADGEILYWNRACSDLTGYPLEQARGRRLWDLVLVPEEVERVKAVFGTMLTSGRPRLYANNWVTKRGERRWIAWSHTLTRHPDGRIQYIVKTGIDRTESKRATEALLASEAMLGARAAETTRLYEDARRVTSDLREANEHMVSATIQAQELSEKLEAALALSEASERELRAVGEIREMFMGILGHDLRNPLGTIALASEVMLQRGRLDGEDKKGLARIIASGQRMSRMIVQLLDFTSSRLGGGFPLEAKPTDLREVCEEVIEELPATFRLEIDGDVSGLWDPDRLAEALSNIAGNAAEHAAPGTAVVLRVYPEGPEVVVEITNQGDPIAPDLLPSIFEPFRRGQRERSTTGNLGLGLYIAKQIVLTSGGTLDVRSAGGSTTFVMRLPRHTPAPQRAWSQAAEATL